MAAAKKTGATVIQTSNFGQLAGRHKLQQFGGLPICMMKPENSNGSLYMISRPPYPIISVMQPATMQDENAYERHLMPWYAWMSNDTPKRAISVLFAASEGRYLKMLASMPQVSSVQVSKADMVAVVVAEDGAGKVKSDLMLRC
jgi:hypothetical protein